MSNGVDFKKVALENRDLLNAALAREAALREELDALRESYEAMRDRKNSIVDLQQRLTVAEKREAELEGLLREVANLDPRGEFLGWKLDGKIEAALKPAEEGEEK